MRPSPYARVCICVCRQRSRKCIPGTRTKVYNRKKVIKRAIIILGRAEIHGRTAKKLTSFELSFSARYDSTSYVFPG